jgi:riboflavin kinase
MYGDKMLSLRKLALIGAAEQPVKLSSSQFAHTIKSSMQTAARRLQGLEREGLIQRRIIADGQWITLTKKGMARLKEEYYEYQRIFSPQTAPIKVEIVGRLFTGVWEGKYYISQNGYTSQFKAKLGFIPFPGTLNLSLSSEDIATRKRLDGRRGIEIEGFESEKRSFGGGKCFNCEILHEGAKGIKSAVIIPDRTHYPEDVLEIISPFYLRDKLRLKDGDEMKIRVMI